MSDATQGPVTEEVAGPDAEPSIDDLAVDAAPAEPEDERSPEELRAALAVAEAARDEYLDQAQRSRAEFHNLRRRSETEMAAARDRGAQGLITTMLTVLDNFGYLVDAVEAAGDDTVSKGVLLVYGELFGVLEGAGLEPIPGVGAPFDPQVHEAVATEPAVEPVDVPVVTEVFRRGWRYKGRTVRPASVKVVG